MVAHEALSSMQVFQHFIIRNSNQELIEERVISKACFHMWLKSRKNAIKHPQDSFRRTILAHLRGGVGRQPFEEDVESSMLQKLRKNTRDGSDDPFKACFMKSKGKRTKRYRSWTTRYKALFGYHEQKKSSSVKKLVVENVPDINRWREMKDEISGLWKGKPDVFENALMKQYTMHLALQGLVPQHCDPVSQILFAAQSAGALCSQ
eukprot:maker-scaffold_7-snap-gene-19.85-mRNA-1 protein AED:0.01 eAED:0.01 QI:205/1/1/1/0.33/0.25/4/333/205